MSCWTCRYQQLAGGTLFGMCVYFERLGRPAREIPAAVVDRGCKFQKDRPEIPPADQPQEAAHGEGHDSH